MSWGNDYLGFCILNVFCLKRTFALWIWLGGRWENLADHTCLELCLCKIQLGCVYVRNSNDLTLLRRCHSSQKKTVGSEISVFFLNRLRVESIFLMGNERGSSLGFKWHRLPVILLLVYFSGINVCLFIVSSGISIHFIIIGPFIAN